MLKRRSIVVATAAGIVFGSVGLAVASGEDAPPPRPSWVSEDGRTIDHEKLPDRIPVVNGRGEVVGSIPKGDLVGPPSHAPAGAGERGNGSELERRSVPPVPLPGQAQGGK